MGYENKYGKITTERGKIPEDEPVFLLRAQDLESLAIIQEYRDACAAAGSPAEHLEGIDAAIDRFYEWRGAHVRDVKVPGTR